MLDTLGQTVVELIILIPAQLIFELIVFILGRVSGLKADRLRVSISNKFSSLSASARADEKRRTAEKEKRVLKKLHSINK